MWATPTERKKKTKTENLKLKKYNNRQMMMMNLCQFLRCENQWQFRWCPMSDVWCPRADSRGIMALYKRISLSLMNMRQKRMVERPARELKFDLWSASGPPCGAFLSVLCALHSWFFFFSLLAKQPPLGRKMPAQDAVFPSLWCVKLRNGVPEHLNR